MVQTVQVLRATEIYWKKIVSHRCKFPILTDVRLNILFAVWGYSYVGCAVTNFTNREISYSHFCFSLLLSPCLRIIGAEEAVCSPDVVASTSSQFRCKGLHYLLATMLNNCSVGPFTLSDFVFTFAFVFEFASWKF
jgi:hypothetical protein